MFDINNLSVVWDFFKLIFIGLIFLFIISFIFAMLQRYISKDTIKKVLAKPHRGLIFNLVIG
jgi:uncharacterized membrane protein YraQ (UPF0718 family)